MVAALIMLTTGPQSAGRSALGAVLAALSLLQLALGTILPDALCRSGAKGSVLASTLLAGVLLATPGWFLMLALVTSQSWASLAVLTAALTLGYGVGFVLTGRFATRTVALANRSNGDD